MPGLCGISWNFTVMRALTVDVVLELGGGLRKVAVTVGGVENSVGTPVFDGGVSTCEVFMVG
jgi:hypothetical protein